MSNLNDSSNRRTAFEDIDFFDDDKSSDEEQRLSWRLDPEDSLSDWTLMIEKEHSGSVQEYHVHKNILAVGPCKSEYFSSVFRMAMREAETSTSHIKLEDTAADVVPCMLDFLYQTEKLEITSPVELRYLAQYFGIKLLHRRVMEFVKTDMTMSNVHQYIQSAKIFSDEKMFHLALHLVIDNIEDLSPTSPLLEVVDPDFFYDIVSSPEVDTCSVSCHLSNLIAAYCQLHTLDEETFQRLTDRRFIPLIDKDSAMTLLELDDATRTTDEAATLTASETTHCLQKRCIKVLAQHWKDLDCWKRAPPQVMGELFDKTLTTARVDMENALSSVQEEIEKHAERMTGKLQAVADDAQQQVDIERTRRIAVEEELQATRRLVVDRERELSEYRREWKRMIRVPVNHHGFRDVKRCTYHHQSSNEPFDNPTKVAQFGKLRPTAMPNVGDAEEDGYLFLTKSGHFMERWPMFYYSDR